MPQPVAGGGVVTATGGTGGTETLNAAAPADSGDVTYPVFVDPDVHISAQLGRTFVDSAYPTQSYFNGSGASDSYMHVGFINAGNSDDGLNHTTRSVWRMNAAPILGKHIVAAHFDTTEEWASSCSARQVDLDTTGNIDATTTWNNQPTWYPVIATANVAYGYNASCPAHAVGFDVTSTVATAIGNGVSNIGFGLRAHDETDWLAWKKFANNPTLDVSYLSPPGQSAGRSISGCSFECSPIAYTHDSTPTLTGATTNADGATMTYTFAIWLGHSATPTTEKTPITTAAVANGALASISPSLADGDYEYTVRACLTADASVCGPWAGGYAMFTVDTVRPAPPTLSPPGPIGSKGADSGTVGVTQDSITISSAASDHVWGYVYTMSASTSPATPPANPVCNTSASGYVTVCPASVGGSIVVQVAPLDNQSALTVWSFDAAGNTDATSHSPFGLPSAVAFYANDDTAPSSGHQWSTLGGPLDSGGNPDTSACPQDSVPDSAPAPLPLQLSGGVCWASDDSPTGPPPISVLKFSGAAAQAVTTASAVDTTKSFTVAAWVKPADASTSLVRPILSEDGSSNAGFALQNSLDHWRFCVTASGGENANPWSGVCAISAATVSVNTWVFVVGIWDAVNRQARLYVTTSGSSSTPAAVISNDSIPASVGKLEVGRDDYYTTSASPLNRYFNGEIYLPTAMPGVLSSGQISELGLYAPPSGL